MPEVNKNSCNYSVTWAKHVSVPEPEKVKLALQKLGATDIDISEMRPDILGYSPYVVRVPSNLFTPRATYRAFKQITAAAIDKKLCDPLFRLEYRVYKLEKHFQPGGIIQLAEKNISVQPRSKWNPFRR